MRPIETEVKIQLADVPRVEQRIAAADFSVAVPRLHEINDVYDTPQQSLRAQEQLLRLRQAGEGTVLTWKGPGAGGPHKSRAELETSVGSHEIMRQVLERLGYRPIFRYEKYRTEFMDRAGLGVVTLDETPIGNFLEIEGPGEWIDQTAGRLGFSPKDYVLESYGKLYLEYCANRGITPTNMVFDEAQLEQPVR